MGVSASRGRGARGGETCLGSRSSSFLLKKPPGVSAHRVPYHQVPGVNLKLLSRIGLSHCTLQNPLLTEVYCWKDTLADGGLLVTE